RVKLGHCDVYGIAARSPRSWVQETIAHYSETPGLTGGAVAPAPGAISRAAGKRVTAGTRQDQVDGEPRRLRHPMAAQVWRSRAGVRRTCVQEEAGEDREGSHRESTRTHCFFIRDRHNCCRSE